MPGPPLGSPARPGWIRETIRAVMKARGLSIRRVSILSGVPYASTYEFLRDKSTRDVSLENAEKLLDALGSVKLVTR